MPRLVFGVSGLSCRLLSPVPLAVISSFCYRITIHLLAAIEYLHFVLVSDCETPLCKFDSLRLASSVVALSSTTVWTLVVSRRLFGISQLILRKMTTTSTSKFIVPDGFTLHTEGSASVLLPERTDTFINPIQEFNRDMSVACISVWAEDFNRQRREREETRALRRRQSHKKRKGAHMQASDSYIPELTCVSRYSGRW